MRGKAAQARRRVAWLGIAAVVCIAAIPCVASATPPPPGSGEITRAQASADWTLGSIAGMAEWTGCEFGELPEEPPGPEEEGEGGEVGAGDEPPPSCRWMPYATVGPGTDPSDCGTPGRRLPALGEGVTLVWEGEERMNPGEQSFDVSEVALSGASGHLLCLSMFEMAVEPVVCAFAVEVECPQYVSTPRYYALDAASLEAGDRPANPAPQENASQSGAQGPPAPPTSFEVFRVPWSISSVTGPRSPTLAWSAKYCLDGAQPELAHVSVAWRRRHKRFRALITVSIRYPAQQSPGAGGSACPDVGQLQMSKRLKLAHPLASSALFDGSVSPPRKRWPG